MAIFIKKNIINNCTFLLLVCFLTFQVNSQNVNVTELSLSDDCKGRDEKSCIYNACCYTKIKFKQTNLEIDACGDPEKAEPKSTKEEICDAIELRAQTYEILECQCGDVKYASFLVYFSYGCCLCCAISIISAIFHKLCKRRKKKKLKSQRIEPMKKMNAKNIIISDFPLTSRQVKNRKVENKIEIDLNDDPLTLRQKLKNRKVEKKIEIDLNGNGITIPNGVEMFNNNGQVSDTLGPLIKKGDPILNNEQALQKIKNVKVKTKKAKLKFQPGFENFKFNNEKIKKKEHFFSKSQKINLTQKKQTKIEIELPNPIGNVNIQSVPYDDYNEEKQLSRSVDNISFSDNEESEGQNPQNTKNQESQESNFRKSNIDFSSKKEKNSSFKFTKFKRSLSKVRKFSLLNLKKIAKQSRERQNDISKRFNLS